MSYSVIQIGRVTQNGGYGLYDSKIQGVIIAGTYDELYTIKDQIEKREQKQSNDDYQRSLRKQWINIMVTAGKTPEEAEDFLKIKLPYLYEE